MSDPRRLVEEGDLGASLLTAALVLDADQARARKAALLGAAASGTAVIALGAAAKALPKTFAAALLTKSVVLGVVVAIVSAGAVGAIAIARSGPGAAPAPATTSRHTLRAAGARAPETPAEAPGAAPAIDRVLDAPSAASAPPSAVDSPSIAPRAAPSASPASARAASSSRAPKHEEAPADVASSCPLAEEVALLQEARSGVGQGQPARALAALDAHAQRCPRGLLGIEAEVLRIEALSRSGDASAARAHARRFIALHPDTPYAARVQALSGEAPESP
jgi:hypothetical protein